MKLSDDRKAAMFKALASKSLYDVGVDFGLDKHYSTAPAVRNKVHSIYKAVANDPEKYAVHPETVEVVVAAVSGRKMVTPSIPATVEASPIVANDIKGLTMGGRDVAAKLITQKLAFLEAHPKALAAESLVNLGKIFGILFDKSQIIQGQATEHVALMGRIDTTMTPEQALDAVLRSREIMQAEKHG